MDSSRLADGRLAMSNEAMKIVAKALTKVSPLSALRAGLRHDVDRNEFLRIKRLTVLSEPGSGYTETSMGLAREAANAGFRTVMVVEVHQASLFYKRQIEGYEDWWKNSDSERPWLLSRSAPETEARLVNLANSSRADHDSILQDYLSTDFLNDRVMDTTIIVPSLREPIDPEEQKNCAEVLRTVTKVFERNRALFSDVMVFFTNIGIGTTPLLSGADFPLVYASGDLRQPVSLQEGDDCMMIVGCRSEKIEDWFCEVTLGTWGLSRPGGFTRQTEYPFLFTPMAGHELSEPVLRALRRMKGESFASMGHVKKLDLVARACGYKDWHAAQASQ